MNYTPRIYDPVQGMSEILDAVERFNPGRFIYALQYKNWNERQLETMSTEVSDYRHKIENEEKQLRKFAKTFNKEFATTNNSCFSSAFTILRKIRSGVSETKRLFKKFCPRARQEKAYHTIGNEPVSAYKYAYISSESYQLPLFEFEGYPPCVSGLYNEMRRFFVVLVRCLKLCLQVLAEEENIKKDPGYCNELLQQFRVNILDEIHDILKLIPRDSELLSETHNPAIASRNRYADDEAWAPVGFHNYSRTDVKQLVIKQVLEEEDESVPTPEERLLFGEDADKVRRYRYIIAHFDELVPDDYRRKNLPAKYIQMFFRYVDIPYKKEEMATNYFNRQYLASPSHKYLTVSYQAINNCKRQVLEDRDGLFALFKEKLSTSFFVPKPVPISANS